MIYRCTVLLPCIQAT